MATSSYFSRRMAPSRPTSRRRTSLRWWSRWSASSSSTLSRCRSISALRTSAASPSLLNWLWYVYASISIPYVPLQLCRYFHVNRRFVPVELIVVLSLQLMPYSCWTHCGTLTSAYAVFLLDSLWYSHFSLCHIPVELVVVLSLYVASHPCWTHGGTFTMTYATSLLKSWWYFGFIWRPIPIEIMVACSYKFTPHPCWNHGGMFILAYAPTLLKSWRYVHTSVRPNPVEIMEVCSY